MSRPKKRKVSATTKRKMCLLSLLLSFPVLWPLTRAPPELSGVLPLEARDQPGERWLVLKDKPPSSGTCKFELGTHLSHSDLAVNRAAAPSEIGFSLLRGCGVDLSSMAQASAFEKHWR